MNAEVNPLFAMTMELKRQLTGQLSDGTDKSSDDGCIIINGRRFPEGHDSARAR